jgi:hypothetical protein
VIFIPVHSQFVPNGSVVFPVNFERMLSVHFSYLMLVYQNFVSRLLEIAVLFVSPI